MLVLILRFFLSRAFAWRSRILDVTSFTSDSFTLPVGLNAENFLRSSNDFWTPDSIATPLTKDLACGSWPNSATIFSILTMFWSIDVEASLMKLILYLESSSSFLRVIALCLRISRLRLRLLQASKTNNALNAKSPIWIINEA